MSSPDPCSLVRIAIALTALKHKPKDQSIASYLLDLKSRFPVATKDSDAREWRTYALELERQLATLKAQRDADQAQELRLRDVSQAASGSDPPPPKKKSKKNPKDQQDIEWSWDQTCAHWSRVLSSQYPSSPSLTTTYASLRGALASPNADLLSYVSCLSDAILRALGAIQVFLFSAPTPTLDPQTRFTLGAPPQLKPEHIDSTRIAMASPLLMYVLRTALHTLVRAIQDSTKSKRQRRPLNAVTLASADIQAHFDKVLDRLLECILLILLHALAPLCFARLAPLLSVPPKKDKNKNKNKTGRSSVRKSKDGDKPPVDPLKKMDTRTDVITLIGTSLEALDALPAIVRPHGGESSIANSIRDRLGLETIRELEALYTIPPPPPSNACPPSSGQPPATPSESPISAPPLPTPAPTPTPTPTPSQSQSQTGVQNCSQRQSIPRTQQCAASASLASRLEKLAGTREERVRALATRDAGWFLASTLSLCVTSALPARIHGHAAESSGETLLREALLDRIGKLIRSVPLGRHVSDGGSDQQRSNGDGVLGNDHDHDHDDNGNTTRPKFAIDLVCQNMLLAVCERAMGQLASPQGSE